MFDTHTGAISAKSRALTTVSAIAIFAATTVANGAQAQTAPPQSAQAPAVEEIVVTGSRVVRNGYEAPTPVTVIGVEQMQEAPMQHISDFVARLPAFGGTAATTTGGGNDISNGRQSQNNLNLRGLDVYRTLVLLDGHRLVSGDVNGAVNINDIPQSLISRVDVVTGGASAAYGSDAVAGVVNFVLDKEFTGVKGEVQGGVTTYGDNRSYKLNLTAGTPFAGGKGHILLSAEYAHNDGVFMNRSRAWAHDGAHIMANPLYNATTNPGVPQLLVRDHSSTSQEAPGGLIVSGPLKGTAFAKDGTPYQFQYGALTNGGFTVGGDWELSDAMQYNQTYANRVGRQNAFFRGSYDVTDNTNLYVQIIQSNSSGYARSKLDDSLGNITVKSDNPYIPAAVSAQMTSLKLTSFALGSFNFDMPPIATDSNRRTWSYAVGADGKIDAFDTTWKWEAFAQYGLAHSTTYGHVINRTNFNLALDSVRNAAGQVVCRVNQSAVTVPDCMPWNPFGWGTNNDKAIAYAKGNAVIDQKRTQDVATVGVSGEPFSSWAGPISIATGIEWRKETTSSVVDAGSQASTYTAGNYKPTTGSYNVTEGYVETVIPLAKDTVWAKSLEFNGAIRATGYSTSGYVTTWKAGLTYQPIDDLRLRVTRSRDIRAPNLGDLYAGGSGGQSPGLIDPFSPGTVLPTFLNNTLGNPALQPEKADTTGLGAVIQPSFFPGFQASVDYFNIDIGGAINTVGAQETLNRCFQGQQDLCATIVRNAQGVITIINGRPFNLNNLQENGLDIETSYHTRLDNINDAWGGEITLRALGTHTFHYRIVDGVNPVIDNAGNNSGGGPVYWRWLFSASYSLDPISFSWTGRSISAGRYQGQYIQCTTACPVPKGNQQTIDSNVIAGAFYHDLSATLKVMEGVQAYVNVSNVMNTKPPQVAQAAYWYMPTNPFFYDTLGRTFYAGVRFKM
jgi:iron complex outermembrane receptor protein